MKLVLCLVGIVVRRSLLLPTGLRRWRRRHSSDTELGDNSSASRRNCVRCFTHDFRETQQVCCWQV